MNTGTTNRAGRRRSLQRTILALTAVTAGALTIGLGIVTLPGYFRESALIARLDDSPGQAIDAARRLVEMGSTRALGPFADSVRGLQGNELGHSVAMWAVRDARRRGEPTKSVRLLRELTEFLSDADQGVRLWALAYLGCFVPESLESLVRHFDHGASYAEKDCILWIWDRWEDAASGALDSILREMRRGEDHRDRCAWTLVSIGPRREDAAVLAECLQDTTDDFTKGGLLAALEVTPGLSESTLRVVCAQMTAKDAIVRNVAVSVLEAQEELPSFALDAMRRLLFDKSDFVVGSAVRCVGKFGLTTERDTLQAHLGYPDDSVRLEALRSLIRLAGCDETIPFEIVWALREALDDCPSTPTLRAVLDKAWEHGDPVVRKFVERVRKSGQP